MSARLSIALRDSSARRVLRLLGSTVTSAGLGWALARSAPSFELAVLCACVCLGLIAGTIERAEAEPVLGAIVLSFGASALAGRLTSLGLGLAAWPLFALALASATAPPRTSLRFSATLVAFALAVPAAHAWLALEGGSLASALVLGAALALVAALAREVRVERIEPIASRGPYRTSSDRDVS